MSTLLHVPAIKHRGILSPLWCLLSSGAEMWMVNMVRICHRVRTSNSISSISPSFIGSLLRQSQLLLFCPLWTVYFGNNSNKFPFLEGFHVSLHGTIALLWSFSVAGLLFFTPSYFVCMQLSVYQGDLRTSCSWWVISITAGQSKTIMSYNYYGQQYCQLKALRNDLGWRISWVSIAHNPFAII